MTLTRPYAKIHNVFLYVGPCRTLLRHLTHYGPCISCQCFITSRTSSNTVPVSVQLDLKLPQRSQIGTVSVWSHLSCRFSDLNSCCVVRPTVVINHCLALARCTHYNAGFNGCGPFDGALCTSCEDICCDSRAENYFEMSPLAPIVQCSALHLHCI